MIITKKSSFQGLNGEIQRDIIDRLTCDSRYSFEEITLFRPLHFNDVFVETYELENCKFTVRVVGSIDNSSRLNVTEMHIRGDNKQEIVENTAAELRKLCAEVYQILAQWDQAPETALDKLNAAANYEPIPDVDLLPWTVDNNDINVN